MARINLLPWRQAERERKNREFMTLLVGVLLLSLLTAFAGWSYFNSTLASQKQANEKIKQENTKLDAALKEIESLEQQRNDMLAQMKVIQDLQGRRPIPVRVWDDIARMIPAQLYLTNIKREGDVITFMGRADNANVVSEFIRNLDGSQWLENSAVKSITQPNAVAYQDPNKPQAGVPTALPATTNTPNGTTKPSRPLYPEDNYVDFTITTNIAKALSPDSATAGTVMSATSSTRMTATATTSSTTHTVANTNPVVSGVNPTMNKATASGTSNTNVASATTDNVVKPVANSTNAHTTTISDKNPLPASATANPINKENK